LVLIVGEKRQRGEKERKIKNEMNKKLNSIWVRCEKQELGCKVGCKMVL